jgi:uncharacterized YkwD family protein
MKRFGKPFIAIALGLALTSISSSAFAATACPFKSNTVTYKPTTVAYKWFPYAVKYPQFQRIFLYFPELTFAVPNYAVPKQPVQQPVKQPVQQPVKQPVKQPVQKPVAQQPSYSKAPAAQPVAPKQGTKVQADQFASAVVNLVNQERAKAGLKPLQADAALAAMARDKAVDMYVNHYFDHTSPTYGSPFDMMRKYRIPMRTAGENIAMGQRSPQEVMNQWMNSAGHRANILNPNFTKIGVAYYNGYWVQEFTG